MIVHFTSPIFANPLEQRALQEVYGQLPQNHHQIEEPAPGDQTGLYQWVQCSVEALIFPMWVTGMFLISHVCQTKIYIL